MASGRQQTRSARALSLPEALGRLRVALEEVYATCSRELGLSVQQAELLCAAMRPTAIGDLARALRCDRSNISRLVDRVTRSGLVARKLPEVDKRVSIVELTPRGRRVAEEFLRALEAASRPLLEVWSPGQQTAAAQTLQALAEVLEVSQSHRRA